MSLVEYPVELSKSHWDRKKDAVPKGSEVETALKALQKKHDAVDWDLFADNWAETPAAEADLEKAYNSRVQTYKSKVLPLKQESAAVLEEAQKLGKTKGLEKVTVDAMKQIVEAAKDYAKAVTGGLDLLEEQFKAAIKEADDEEEVSALLDPKKLRSRLDRCKQNPDLQVSFAFVDAQEDQPSALLLGKPGASASLFARLKKETGGKTGAHGAAQVQGTVVRLQIEKAVPGLVKKIRVPIVKTGFRVTRILIVDLLGATLEQEDDERDEGGEYERKLAELEPYLLAALKRGVPEASKLRAASVFAQEKAEAGNYAAALRTLAGMEKILIPEDQQGAFKNRGNGLVTRIKEAIAANRPGAADLRGRMTEANTLAQKMDFLGAEAILDEVEEWLKGENDGGIVKLQSSRLTWNSLRGSVQQQLQTLEKELLAAVRANNADPDASEEFDEEEVAERVRSLYQILDRLDTRLIDKLDQALNASGERRSELQSDAKRLVREYQAFVDADPLMAQIDLNGFTRTSIQAEARKALTELAQQL